MVAKLTVPELEDCCQWSGRRYKESRRRLLTEFVLNEMNDDENTDTANQKSAQKP